MASDESPVSFMKETGEECGSIYACLESCELANYTSVAKNTCVHTVYGTGDNFTAFSTCWSQVLAKRGP